MLEGVSAERGPIASVAPLAPIDRTYSYRVPAELAGRVAPGTVVAVRLGAGRRAQPGVCVSISEEEWDATLRPIEAVLDERPLLDARMLELGQWISRYYACPPGPTLRAMIPAGRRQRAGARRVRWVRLVRNDAAGLPPKQAAALSALATGGGEMRIAALCAAAGCGAGVVAALAKDGRAKIETRREIPEPGDAGGPPPAEPAFALTGDQQRAISRLTACVEERAFRVVVLFGVTGSGKTECYVRAIRAAVAAGRQAILLVPEIALTTQTAQRLARRFERVAVLHSALSDAQRGRLWEQIAAGGISVMIGTRSAVFAPCPRPGLIVVDEESEPGYKNQAAPRYHTRDVAIKRGQIESIPVVLGSAAPSLETWLNATTQAHYELIRLPRRVAGLPMPRVQVVDMRDEQRARRGVHLLSRLMEDRLAAVLGRGEQSVLLLNRRGYASFLFCARCRTPIVCPNCSVHLVFHATAGAAICHYCHERLIVPARCAMAGCGGTLVRFGMGTQRVEQELAAKFPAARIARFDSDVMRRAEDYARVLGDFEARRIDVLVGTQMVAKGLDFPFVSFVGVVSADTALALPDFRAAERTFQLVLQVAGRSGRSEVGGEVVVQTFAGHLPAIQRAVSHDYDGFAAHELEARRRVRLPPHARLVRIVLADARLTRVQREAEALAARIGETLAKFGAPADVIAPQPSPIQRIRNQYRYDLLLRFAGASAMIRSLDALRGAGALKARVRTLVVDVDPVSLQ